MANYNLTVQADADLNALLSYGIINYGETRADQYFDGLIAQFEVLAATPHLYASRHEIDPPVRICPYGVHIIIYNIQSNDNILIIRVRHGREDWM